MKAVDAFEEKEVNKVMSFYMLTVHRDYTWRGLGTKLVEFSVARGIEEGCHNAIVCISNKFSYRIFVRLGFEARHFFDLLPHREEWGLDIPALQGNTSICAMTKRLP
ncbi:uncharacterized protein LOC122256967 [Penaeus japonicus]|uniref:uncharacterized protein LOC122256967 n=1 Tax=Penaeus japonicus TaxID=27405 RepID=UPI001C71399B|nr:uncharacterized protein LOC122256967 [Penaeus japonicus]